MKLTTGLLILILPSLGLAAAGHHGEGVPKVTIYQLINLVILFAGITYFTKDAIIEFFSTRKQAYLEASKKAAQARAQAELEFATINEKLKGLASNYSQSLENAKNQASEIKKQMANDSALLANRIKEDAKLTVNLEVQRAQRELRDQLLKDSVDAARSLVTKDLSSSDQQKLQKDFINQVGV